MPRLKFNLERKTKIWLFLISFLYWNFRFLFNFGHHIALILTIHLLYCFKIFIRIYLKIIQIFNIIKKSLCFWFYVCVMYYFFHRCGLTQFYASLIRLNNYSYNNMKRELILLNTWWNQRWQNGLVLFFNWLEFYMLLEFVIFGRNVRKWMIEYDKRFSFCWVCYLRGWVCF